MQDSSNGTAKSAASFASVSRFSAMSQRIKSNNEPGPGAAALAGDATAAAGRKGSQSSTISSSGGGGTSKATAARSFLSSGGGGVDASSAATTTAASSGPLIEGNVATLGGIDCGEEVISVQHTENGAALLTGLFSGVIKVFNAHAGSVIATLDPDSIEDKDDIVGNDNGGGFGRGYPLSRLRCKPYSDAAAGNTLVAATYASGHLRVWNYANSTCVGQVRDERSNAEYLCLSYNPFVDVIAVGEDNGHIKLYDENTLQVVSLLKKSLDASKTDGHADRVLCIENHPLNPHEFVSSGYDDTMQFWDARCPNAVRSAPDVTVCGDGIRFDRRGRDLLVASWRPDNQLQIVDYSTAKARLQFEPEPQSTYLTCAQYLGKDFIVAGGTNRGIVRIYDRHRGTVVATVREISGVYDIDVPRRGAAHGAAAAAAAGGGGGQAATPAAVAANKFVMTSGNNVVTMDYFKSK